MNRTSHTVIVLLLLLLPSALRAQETPEGMHFPAPGPVWSSQSAIGLRLLTVPRDIAEEELNKAPSIEAQSVLSLPWHFSVRGGAVLQVLTNELRLGTHWSWRLGDVSMSVGDDWAFWFGFMNLDGFDNRANGWINYPGVAVGIDLGAARLSARGEGIFLLSQHTLAGESEVSSTKRMLVGTALTLAMEQPISRGTEMYLGVRLSRTKFHYQTWFAFSTFDRHLLFSELLIGVLL
ncbi:MAG: hypothetical protein RBU27_00435 [Bacteroidota bacterium]|jgi:hypothetical protein|nr:hypothetical protein [Bacteroidota bacterium]